MKTFKQYKYREVNVINKDFPMRDLKWFIINTIYLHQYNNEADLLEFLDRTQGLIGSSTIKSRRNEGTYIVDNKLAKVYYGL